MSGTGAGQGDPPAEPSMEDILASIRRILHDDSDPAQPGDTDEAGPSRPAKTFSSWNRA